jgi:hypothetical protein
VCVTVPEDVQNLPPSCPVYNVKYVYVYDYTPSVVYVGYTPGYTWSFIHGGCVVYGTGYRYRPWYGHHYYPRPVTYGFGVHWNPYTGWGFSFGFSYGWLGVGWHRPYYTCWWGPAGYRYGYRHGYWRGYHHGYRAGYYAGRRAGYVAGYHARKATPYAGSNIYRARATGVTRTGDLKWKERRPVTAERRPAAVQPAVRDREPVATQQIQNNVYTDRNGNVYRRTDKGWETRDRGGWSASDRAARPSTRQNLERNQAELNRHHEARQSGTQRNRSYQTWQGSGQASRPGGTPRPQQSQNKPQPRPQQKSKKRR